MKSKVIVNYEYRSYEEEKNRKETFEYYYDKKTTFGDLQFYLNASNLIVITNNLVEGEKFYLSKFDYILIPNDVMWNQLISDTKIEDYLNTFNCATVKVATIDGIGAVNFCCLDFALNGVKEIITFLWQNRENISFLFTLIEIITFISNYIKKEYKKHKNLIQSESFFFAVLLKNNWKLNEFCKQFKCKENIAIGILELLGYKHNKQKNIYHITNKRREQNVSNIRKIMTEFSMNYTEI